MKQLILGLALLAGGCAYQAEVINAPAYNVYSSYNDPLPGKYLLSVDSTAMETIVRPADLNCAAHNFPLNLQDAFRDSVRLTFNNLVKELEQIEDLCLGRIW